MIGGSLEADRWNEAWEAPEAGSLLYTDMPSTARTLIPCQRGCEAGTKRACNTSAIISVIKLPRSVFRAAKGQVFVNRRKKIDMLVFLFVFNS